MIKNLQKLTLLSLIKIFNLSFPLIIIPIIISKVGLAGYGEIIFYQSIAAYLSIIIRFGSDIKSIKVISQFDRLKLISSYMSSLITIQLILLATIIFLLIGSLFFIKFSSFLVLLFFILNFSKDITFTEYYHIATNNEWKVLLLNFLYRGMSLILIYLFLDHESPIYTVPLFYAISIVIPSVLNISWFMPKVKLYLNEIKSIFILHKDIVISKIIIGIKDQFGQIFIGVFIGMEQTAFYDIGIKIINTSSIPISVFNNYFLSKKNQGEKFKILKIISLSLLTSVAVVIFFYFSAEFISHYLDLPLLDFKRILFIVSFGIIAMSIGSAAGINGLIAINKDIIYKKGMIYTTILFISLLTLMNFVNVINPISLLSIPVIAYIFEMIYRLYYLNKYLFNFCK